MGITWGENRVRISIKIQDRAATSDVLSRSCDGRIPINDDVKPAGPGE